MPGRRRPPLDRVLDKCVDSPDGCVLFVGARNTWGYGKISNGRNRWLSAHHVTWEARMGPVPKGMTLDHRCGVRNCVNVDHLRAVTPSENRSAITSLSTRNTSGYRGVSFQKGRYVAQVRVGRKNHYLGRFDSAVEAAEVARQGRVRLHSVVADSDLVPVGSV